MGYLASTIGSWDGMGWDGPKPFVYSVRRLCTSSALRLYSGCACAATSVFALRMYTSTGLSLALSLAALLRI